MDWIEYFNPFRYVSSEKYISFWSYLMHNVLQGFWARLIAVIFFVLALYVGLRRQNVRGAVIFYLLAFLVAYIGGVYSFLKNLFVGMKFLGE
ncbi:MAG: hypothetical protein QXX12_03660 [Nanopusillaceae archaeon]